MRNVSLKTAIVVTFLLVMAIPLWLAWTWPRHQAYMAERNAVESRHLVIAKTIRAALERYEADVSKIFDYFAVELDMAHDAHIEAAQGMLDGFGFRHICRFEIESGALLASAALPGLPCPVAVPDDKVEMLHTEAREDEVTFSPVMLTSDGQPAVFVMRRAGDEVTVGALTTEYFRSLGKTVVFGELGHAAIVDRTGHVLSHPKDEWLVPPRDLSGVSVVQAMMQGGSGTDEFFSPAMNLQMVAGYASMESTGWGVMVPQPVQELQALADNVRAATVWTLIIAVGVATLLALLAAHVLVEPLRSIRTRAEQLGTGSGDSMIVPAGIATRLTEFDDLRAAFNAMVLRVRTAQRTEVEARRDAQEANRTKSRFLANMSHELRTPLNAIIGFAQITRRRLKENHADRDREDEYLGYIDQSGQHLLALIDDLLDLSKIEAGARVLEEEEVSVQTIINDVHALVATTAQEKMHTIDRLLPLPADLKIKADPRAVRQMLQNLASNAVRYTDPGGLISISAELHRSGCVVLAVTDNGPGIPEDERKNVLRPFARGKVIERSAMQGTGLGLNIVEALSELHGAKLELLSREGGGTVARITFPAFRTILEPEADAPRKRTSRAARKPRAHSA